MEVWYPTAYTREGHRVTEKTYFHSITVSKILFYFVRFYFVLLKVTEHYANSSACPFHYD